MTKASKRFHQIKRYFFPSPAEKKFMKVMGFWYFVRYTVIREYPLSGYYIDFAVPARNVAIEVDGKDYHGGKRDIVRDMAISSHHWHVLRIPAAQLWRDPKRVKTQVKLFTRDPYAWSRKYG